MGYTLIPGRPLWREAFQAISDEAGLSRMAGQLAGFLLALHTIPPEEIVQPDHPVADSREDIQESFTGVARLSIRQWKSHWIGSTSTEAFSRWKKRSLDWNTTTKPPF